ncbi:MAG: L-threonine aldolase, partial [Ornithinibacter sp.]|nr:L-threonine aldolase [Ornithinibacter sp.]
KRYGAGMRQVGILAAAGLYALDHHLERLSDDHARAARFASACAESAPGSVEPDTVQTNIVVLDVGVVGWDAPRFVAALLEHGIRTYAVAPGLVRAVWHLDVDDAGTTAAVDAATALLGGARTA